MDIWRYQDKLITHLAMWALFSIGAGLFMSRARSPEIQGAGKQFIGWGMVNALIAAAGRIFGRRQRQRTAGSDLHMVAQRETRNLSRLLWVNAGLDIFYMLGGALLMSKRGKQDKQWLGQGLGIFIQGGFLFGFDVWHALQLPPAEPEIQELHPDA
jgi:hypothetical protein